MVSVYKAETFCDNLIKNVSFPQNEIMIITRLAYIFRNHS